jgi:asparagine synthase (glutamine-hydrolysing)
MFRYQGLIDFSTLGAISAGALPLELQGDLLDVSLPGIELRWKRGCADVALKDGVVALAAGRARDSTPAPPGEAARWIERYARLGDRAPVDVGGGFAVTILDLAQRRALLFVDRFSIETLCYRSVDGKLGFADAACAIPGADKTIAAQAIYDYLYFHVIPGPQTVFANVQRLEAAHQVTVDRTAAKARAYWTPTFVEDDDRDLPGRLRQFVEIVRRSVEQEADDPATACFLSGGTDSSTIAGMLTHLRGEPVPAYSIGFEAAGYDEMEFARIAARHFKLVHHEYYITPDDLVRAIPQVAASFDQPFGNSSVLPAYYCALRAKEDGFQRMLAGDGGDELFGGNSRYAMQKVFELYHALPRTVRGAILEPAATGWDLFRRVPGFRQLGGYVRHSMMPMPARLETFNLLHRLGEDSLLEAEFRASVDPDGPLKRQRAVWESAAAASLLNRMLGYDWKFTLADSDLPKVRGATQLAGISVGYPFLSRALTDFSLSIPPHWKLKGLKLRWFFKEALRGFLPAELLRKKKHGFGLPFGHWALTHARLRKLVEESLDGIASRGIVRPRFITELMSKRLAEAPGYYGEMAWILMMLEQWLRAHEATLAFRGASASVHAARPNVMSPQVRLS